jgi:hypothetical protein
MVVLPRNIRSEAGIRDRSCLNRTRRSKNPEKSTNKGAESTRESKSLNQFRRTTQQPCSNRENPKNYYFHHNDPNLDPNHDHPTLPSQRRIPKPHAQDPRSKSETQAKIKNCLIRPNKDPKTNNIVYNGALKMGEEFYKVVIEENAEEECVEIMYTNHKNMKLEICKKFDVQIWGDILENYKNNFEMLVKGIHELSTKGGFRAKQRLEYEGQVSSGQVSVNESKDLVGELGNPDLEGS